MTDDDYDPGPILTIVHCNRCRIKMLVQYPPTDPTEAEVALVRAAHFGEAWAIAELDQLKARLLVAHQAGQIDTPCRQRDKERQVHD